ncbi:T3SS regulon translocated regulator ExsE family protein [Pseudomonas koreensis]|uniref:T3SS regulon translocated regulator ExsE family protein n=1 Tax=Pseudomonas koreensis TaxID=198620 RepID=UPI001B319DC9|nr:T3SS regulon translocated regulator ExsE family protein [Pseudomonas koreensis]MBP3996489.1 T3SS regulon translocated regulator ExsE family protein [Pseudomonas koreensis]
MKIDSAGLLPAATIDRAQVPGSFAGRSLSQVPSRQEGVTHVGDLGRWLATQVGADQQNERQLQRLADGDSAPLYERQVRRP